MAKKAATETTQPPFMVIALCDSPLGSCQVSNVSQSPRRRSVKTDLGTYQLQIPWNQPFLLVGDAELAAFAPDVEAGNVSVLEVAPERLSQIACEALNDAAAARIAELEAEVARLRGALRDELAEVEA